MNVRELIEYLSTQNPDALVVEEVSLSSDEFVELTAEHRVAFCGVDQSGRGMGRLYKAGRGRIPCVILTVDNERR